MEEFDPRQPGSHIGTNMSAGNQIKPVFTADYYAISEGIYAHIERMFKWADYLIGSPGLGALATLRQMPSDQTIEKSLEAMGALVWDMSREVEQGLSQFGELWKCMSFQRYDSRRIVQMVGLDGLTPEILDYDPNTAVPSHMPNEDEKQPSQYNIYQRARHYMNLMYMQITPNTAHQVTQMSRRLYLERLREQNFPLDPWTLAEASDIPNFGPVPTGTNNVIERWVYWQKLLASLEAVKAKLVQIGVNDAGAPPEAAASGGDTGDQHPQGRPPEGLSGMRLEQKSDGQGGTRSSITQS